NSPHAGGDRAGRIGCRAAMACLDPRPLRIVEVDVGDLTGGVDPGIRSSGDDELHVGADDAGQRGLKSALHGAQTGLLGPPAEVRAGIGDVQADSHSTSLRWRFDSSRLPGCDFFRLPAGARYSKMLTQTTPTRFAGLDGLRAIAVTLVVVYHLFPVS